MTELKSILTNWVSWQSRGIKIEIFCKPGGLDRDILILSRQQFTSQYFPIEIKIYLDLSRLIETYRDFSDFYGFLNYFSIEMDFYKYLDQDWSRQLRPPSLVLTLLLINNKISHTGSIFNWIRHRCIPNSRDSEVKIWYKVLSVTTAAFFHYRLFQARLQANKWCCNTN